MLFIILYHFLFFWDMYANPFNYCRGELAHQFFPSFIHLGRGERSDPYYWLNYKAHPMLASFYPPHWILARLTTKLSLNLRYKLLLYLVTLHKLFEGIGWYLLFGGGTLGILCSISLTYLSFTLRNEPAISYTVSWIPWMLLGNSISIGMMFLAGYYPVVVMASLLWLIKPNIIQAILGLVIGLPQIVPFLKYLPKTVKRTLGGKLPEWEDQWYFGVVPLFFLSFSYSSLLILIPFFMSIGLLKVPLTRLPKRWMYLTIIILFLTSIHGNVPLWLLLIHATDILRNRRQLIPSPYIETARKPSLFFGTTLARFLENCKGRVSGLPYPLYTGAINRIKTMGYCGCMQNKLMSKWRGGDDHHDWFQYHEDSPALDSYRVQYAYTRKKIGWNYTGIKNLYRNPRFQ